MHHWIRRLTALAAPLLLAGCLWGPGKFTSDLALRKDGGFTLDYKGEIVLQLPPLEEARPWQPSMAVCYKSGKSEIKGEHDLSIPLPEGAEDPIRKCSAAEIAKLKAQHEKEEADRVQKKRKDNEEMAKVFGLPGFDDESNRAFAAKLMKYEGWRSVTYRGRGVFDVDYHFVGRASQDFAFPMLPDNDLIIPFVAIRRRADGSVLVTAPAMTGGSGPLASRAGAAAKAAKDGPASRANGRFTVITDGEILTNNSEDGSSAHPTGRQVHWDVGPASSKIPETLVRLR